MLLFSCFFFSAQAQNCASFGTTIYVNASAGGANNGATWTDAFTDLQSALSVASTCTNVAQIWVAKGTYKPTNTTDITKSFSMLNNVGIYGGFAGGEAQLTARNWTSNPTILSGDIGTVGNNSDNSFSVISNNGLNSTALIDGFTISGGNGGSYGGGMYNNSSSPSLNNITFTNNSAFDGGGMYNNNNSSPSLNNMVFANNSARHYGGGMHNENASSPSLTNVTFANNSANFACGGLSYNSSSYPIIKNCIFWGNSYVSIQNIDGSSYATVTYSDVQGSYYAGTGNINADPLFVSSTDFSLQACSPAKDAGTNAGVSATDFVGNVRPYNNGITDMGAYEFQGIGGATDTPSIWKLSVADSGPGIHPHDIPNVFNRFYQSNRPEMPVEGGTGIGLALAKELALVMNGNISIESVYGKGATFILELPKREVFGLNSDELLGMSEENTEEMTFIEADTDRKQLTFENEIPTNSSQKTILIIEDNASLCDYLKLILSDKYHIVTAENGQEALSVLRFNEQEEIIAQSSKLKVDLIVTDIMMPVMDGFQFLENLKSDKKLLNIPVVMLTARADIQDKLEALTIGVDDYLIKPFDEDELFARIKNLLKNAVSRQQSALSYEPVAISFDKQEEHIAQSSFLIADKEWLEAVEKEIRLHISESNFSVDKLSDLIFLSRAQIYRRLQTLTGLTPLQYILEIKFNYAREILEKRQMSSVKSVAAAVGIQKTQYFSEQFKERFGKSPSDFFA